MVRNDEIIPADIMIISSSEADCVCYIETKNLDGETNLKIKRGVSELEHVKTPSKLSEIKCSVDVEPPNELMYNFAAAMKLQTTNIPRNGG